MKAATPTYDFIGDSVSISIHAAREGGDGFGMAEAGSLPISIHAAREGGDVYGNLTGEIDVYFNPRRP